MEKKIQELYQNLVKISAGYLIYQKRNNIELMRKMMPQIQEFVLWFLEGNIFGIEETLYQNMSQDILGILEDIVAAMEQGDRVLMQDAMAYGLLEYLELFIESEQEDGKNDNI
ncbi:MAG: hypothetical protein HFH41_00730 [Lachnospiraceae bacterium]|nr:hypothetical protein [Lachnospiraceae bacterium]